MSDRSALVRFGVALEGDLLEEFDAQIRRKGYTNRSEAIRDLMRAGLVEETIVRGGNVTGALMIVYRHHVRELTEKLTEIQHELGDAVVSALHVHLDHDHCLEVIVMRGAATTLQDASARILATKGVVHGKLSVTSIGPSAATTTPTTSKKATKERVKRKLHRHDGGKPHRHS